MYALLVLLFWSAAWTLDVTGRAVLRDMEREKGWLATQEAGVLRFGRLRVLKYLRSTDWRNSPLRRSRARVLVIATGVMVSSCLGVVAMVGWGHRLCTS